MVGAVAIVFGDPDLAQQGQRRKGELIDLGLDDIQAKQVGAFAIGKTLSEQIPIDGGQARKNYAEPQQAVVNGVANPLPRPRVVQSTQARTVRSVGQEKGAQRKHDPADCPSAVTDRGSQDRLLGSVVRSAFGVELRRRHPGKGRAQAVAGRARQLIPFQRTDLRQGSPNNEQIQRPAAHPSTMRRAPRPDRLSKPAYDNTASPTSPPRSLRGSCRVGRRGDAAE